MPEWIWAQHACWRSWRHLIEIMGLIDFNAANPTRQGSFKRKSRFKPHWIDIIEWSQIFTWTTTLSWLAHFLFCQDINSEWLGWPFRPSRILGWSSSAKYGGYSSYFLFLSPLLGSLGFYLVIIGLGSVGVCLSLWNPYHLFWAYPHWPASCLVSLFPLFWDATPCRSLLGCFCFDWPFLTSNRRNRCPRGYQERSLYIWYLA